MNAALRALLERRQQAVAAAKAITDGAAAATRDLTAEERTNVDAHLASITTIDADIARQRAIIEAERGAQTIAVGDGARVTNNLAEDPRGGFQNFAQFAQHVRQANPANNNVSRELAAWNAAAPSTYGNEGNMADGGFLVPPEFSRNVYRHSLEQDAFLPLTDDIPVTGNSMTFPRDETTPWGTDGMRAYWANEAGVATQTKPKGDTATLRLSKLIALVPITDELAADAAALEAYITPKCGESIRWKTNLALFSGTGVGQPKGWFVSGGPYVSVAKEASQTAATFNAANAAKMLGRLPSGSISRAVWLLNNDVFPQLPLMTIGQQPVWTPPNEGFKNAPNGFLLGRPIMLTQVCQTLGTQGDVALVDWKAYRSISKAVQMATSMHLYFDADAMAFRLTFRVDGQPAIKAAISPANGSNSLSPFVVLDTRA
jgi:HK97 family phage major capsid protein